MQILQETPCHYDVTRDTKLTQLIPYCLSSSARVAVIVPN